MKLGNAKDSNNFEDRTGQIPSTAQKFLWEVGAFLQRHIGTAQEQATQRRLDKQKEGWEKANREYPLDMSPEKARQDMQARVIPRADGSGWDIKRPGVAWDEFAPSLMPASQAAIKDLLTKHTISSKK